jgi:hypothetical protein
MASRKLGKAIQVRRSAWCTDIADGFMEYLAECRRGFFEPDNME